MINNHKKNKLLPVILCGGKGQRLWPLSRESFPKQFTSIGKSKDKSLLQKTFERILLLDNIELPMLVCNEEHRFIAAEQIREVEVKAKTILLEPFSRGTAPAIALSALKALKDGTDPLLLILSSDHEILDDEGFVNSIEGGIDSALEGRIVTFGVIPSSAETGYGYIESESPIEEQKRKPSRIIRFIEKPNKEKAEKFYQDKRFAWNSGIFLFKASTIKEEIYKFYPEIIVYCEKALEKNSLDLDFFRIDKESFYKCPNISIDNAVMEKTSLGTVVPLYCDWRDLGSWKEVWESSKKDDNGNVIEGKILLQEGSNCFLKSEDRLVVGLGLNNLIVVDTSDALLVLNKDYSQDIKSVVQKLKKDNFLEGREHKKIFRPWGNYTSLVEEKNWKVKKIVVYPKHSLSLQSHNFRSENWVIINGTAKVEIDNEVSILESNQNAYIPLGSKHRLSNPGNAPLILIEVQSGTYLEEDDIVRFKDNYGRVNLN